MSYGNYTPDPQQRAKLQSQMERGIAILNSIIDSVTSASAPYRVQGTFLNSPGLGLAVVAIGDKRYRVRKDYCYFVIGQTDPGTTVEVDSRYIVEQK